ncbi:DNA-methyltransferase [Burkholderia ubonensis]|uniref:DNA-methyltransferase n=1 Tax=Burkholderia ubonensis TaxID=101571 RepID=UPI00075B0111|nr:site-specific DNA-methyltransferase [Burkholderia ubonensis]KVC61855.1 DNA methylase N-4 [Burkholderia ubonensis]KVS40964.1 DNA methylase N-4 [Burkholderia ubonensis]KVS53124.1 DNA methylase N-4 [Burkholderia ubonensis]KVS71318.1 DNA methylase N-4 [Burkholderia ubonensis]KVS83392.1 DNA methylase N-4 [Burkholderia ubonensis]
MTTVPTDTAPAADLFPMLNRLHNTDALALARRLPDRSLDLVFTDPPYASGGLHLSARTRTPTQKYIESGTKTAYEDFEGDNMDQRAWAFWCHAWLTECRRALKPSGLLACFIDWRQLATLTDVVQAAGLTFRGIAVWDKTPGRFRPRRGGFAQQAEFLVWASRGAMPDRDVYLPGVFPVRLPLPKRHMTEKPLELAREVVRLVPDGGVVCDLFAGSGTFLVAAREAGLDWIGCETNQAYHEIASTRLAAVSGSAAQVA